MEDVENLKRYINNTSKLINQNINLYIIALIKYLFLAPNKPEKTKEVEKKLIDLTNKINQKIVKHESKFIDVITEKKYSIQNFNNIIYFINTQNTKFSGDILEVILILIISKIFKTDKTNTFGKYIFNNLSKLKDSTNYELAKWLQTPQVFKNKEKHDIKELLSLDATFDDANRNEQINNFQNNSPFFNLLLEIYKYKYIHLAKEYKNNKTMYYINRGIFNSQEMGNKIYEQLKDNSKTTYEKDLSSNSISKLLSCLYFSGEFGKIRTVPIHLIRAFFISVYIYYQNKNSPLMKYIEPLNYKKNKNKDIKDEKEVENDEKKNENIEQKKDLEYIPFVYDLKSACVEGRFANLILSPLRIEPRLSKIILDQNNLREAGLFEIAKTLIFNKNIKMIDYNKSLLKTYYLDYFNFGFGIFDNYNLEELNIAYNYIKEDCGEYLSKFLYHLKGLKAINLSLNDFKSGISTVFIGLRKLYRNKKINLETIYLNRCLLDDTALYELGELLQSKYCKLKRLYFSMNNKANCFNFLKKIKKNRSLIEINFTKNNYSNNNSDDINKIISSTNINHLYLSKNKITDFKNCIKILYRTKIINDKKNKNIMGENNHNEDLENQIKYIKEKNNNILIEKTGMLFNLDLSGNEAWTLNKKHIYLLYKIFYETTLSCLDISHIIYGSNPDKVEETKQKPTYIGSVNMLKNALDKNKKNYRFLQGNKIANKVNIKKNNEYFEKEKEEEKQLIQKINKIYGNYINLILQNELANQPVFLKEQICKIIEIIIKDNNFEDIRDKLNYQYKKELSLKLEKYISLKKSEKDLININQKLKNKKLFII